MSGPTDALGRPLAAWWQRVLAIIIDGFVTAVPGGIVFAIIVGASTTTTTDAFGNTMTLRASGGALAAGYLVVLLVILVYFGLLDGSQRGQTVGKMALGIATRDRAGGPVGFWRAFARRLLYQILFLVLFVPGLLNVLSPLWDARRQAWHDKAVGTVVVKVR